MNRLDLDDGYYVIKIGYEYRLMNPDDELLSSHDCLQSALAGWMKLKKFMRRVARGRYVTRKTWK